MSSKSKRVPSHRRHTASGQARVIVNAKHTYLGRYGAAESREVHARLRIEMSADAGRVFGVANILQWI
jgi:hypothetical protein